MTGRERVKAVINHGKADRIPVAFNSPHPSDVAYARVSLKKPTGVKSEYFSFGQHEELLKMTGGFDGEVRIDNFGNIIGRLRGLTKGECVRGALEDWEQLGNYKLPEIDVTFFGEKEAEKYKSSDKYIIGMSPYAVFSVLRDTRKITNALTDTVLEKDNVKEFLGMILKENLRLAEYLGKCGADALMMCDDWGTQDRTFISPESFRELFKPVYSAIAGKLHSLGMHFILHSCGYNYGFMDDFIGAGIDVLQFDQLGAYGYEKMAGEFAGRVTFWSPLDIQKTLPTGDRNLIESEALRMVDAFKGKGSLILKDYPTYQDIGVKEEWADYARNVFLANL